MKRDPKIVIRLEGGGRAYRPGESLAGEYWIEGVEAAQVRAVEASVLWHTEGKGDEDMAVARFWRWDADDEQPLDATRPQPFSDELPYSPLSYDGQILQVRWCVRVRVFLRRGKEVVGEKSFRLGDVAMRPSGAGA